MAAAPANSLAKERREFRRICDAVALDVERVDDPENPPVSDISVPCHPTHVVSLSPNGMRFFYPQAFAAGETVRIGLGLFPGDTKLLIDAEVMNSGERTEAPKTQRFFVGLAFRNLGDDERQLLIRHIEAVAQQSFGGAVKIVN